MQLYRWCKAWFYSFADRLIELGDSWLDRARHIEWAGGRRLVQALGQFIGDLGRLLRDLFRQPAYKATGAQWTVVFVGGERERLEVERLFFAGEEVIWQALAPVALWRLPATARQWLADGVDLVICELSRLLPAARGIRYSFVTPPHVGQVLALPEKVETLLAGDRMHSWRKYVNRAKRNGYGYRFSQSEADYDYFYHRMYVPYITARHGKRAHIGPGDNSYLKQKFYRGGLLLVTQNDEPVAGDVCYRIREAVFGVAAGVLDAKEELIQDHINVLISWYEFVWASSQGARVVNLGPSRGWRSDGVFWFKAHWGAQVTRSAWSHNAWHVYAQQPSPALRERLNEIGFISERGGQCYTVMIAPESAGSMRETARQALADIRGEGFRGVVVIAPYSQGELVEQAEPAADKDTPC